jgi:hypothetical protein
MGAGTGKHTISMKGIGDGIDIDCGVVRDGLLCNETHLWVMCSDNGGLCGGHYRRNEAAGGIKPGQVLTMQVDTDAGTLKFWVDGKPHGPGFTDRVTGNLRWATIVYSGKNNAVKIVPTPELRHAS